MRVLIVDDDDTFCRMLAAVLQSEGIEVERADCAIAALDMVDAGRRFDLFVVDIRLQPGQPNGLALVRMLRIKVPAAQIVHVTAQELTEGESREATAPVLLKSLGLVRIAAEIRQLAQSG